MKTKLIAILATATLLTGCASASAPAPEDTPNLRPALTFSQIADKLDGASIPCSAKAAIDYEFETVDCQNEKGDNADAWLLATYSQFEDLKQQKNQGFCDWSGKTLIGDNWIVWWNPSDEVLAKLQERLGGEIVNKADWCKVL